MGLYYYAEFQITLMSQSQENFWMEGWKYRWTGRQILIHRTFPAAARVQKYIAKYYINKIVSMSSASVSSKIEKTTPTKSFPEKSQKTFKTASPKKEHFGFSIKPFYVILNYC